MVAAITLTPNSGPVGTAGVVVAGTGFTSGQVISILTFGSSGTPATNTVIGQVVAVAGTFSGTFTVPAHIKGAVTVTASDVLPESATATFTITAKIVLAPVTGSEDTSVTVTGTGYSGTAALTAITIGGVVPLSQTVTAQTTNATGGWSGTFVVPVLTTGPQTVTATTAADTASATFTVSGQSIGPDSSGPVHGTATNAQTVTATLTTTSAPDLVVAVVAWEDTGTATVVVTDAVPLVWYARGPIRAYGNFKIQEWYASAAATIGGKVVTAAFSVAPTGRQAITVCGFANTNLSFDTNLGLPGEVNATGTFSSVTSSVANKLVPDLLLGALLVAPQATITAGTGWIPLDAVNATDFELQTEYSVASVLSQSTGISWTVPSAPYTSVGLVDAVQSIGATAFPWTAKDIGAQVTSNGASEQGVAYWFYPQISTSGDVVTFDRSIGDINSLQPLTGTTTSATNLVLTDTTLALTVNALAGAILTYVSGTAKGESRVIASNTATTITTSPAFLPIPTALGGDSYRVTSPEFYQVEQHLASNNPVVGRTDGATNTWTTYSPV